jgi:hypothetical protein
MSSLLLLSLPNFHKKQKFKVFKLKSGNNFKKKVEKSKMFSRLSLIALMLVGFCPTVLANQSEKIAPWGRVRSLSELRQLPLSKNPQDSLSQINSVDQLRDVQPNVWAYEALKSLVERYGCIVGYPDATFRGDRG